MHELPGAVAVRCFETVGLEAETRAEARREHLHHTDVEGRTPAESARMGYIPAEHINAACGIYAPVAGEAVVLAVFVAAHVDDALSFASLRLDVKKRPLIEVVSQAGEHGGL